MALIEGKQKREQVTFRTDGPTMVEQEAPGFTTTKSQNRLYNRLVVPKKLVASLPNGRAKRVFSDQEKSLSSIQYSKDRDHLSSVQVSNFNFVITDV